jgi:hypothetical protein
MAGLDFARLRVGSASVDVCYFGAHVTSWKEGHDDYLFLSKKV